MRRGWQILAHLGLCGLATLCSATSLQPVGRIGIDAPIVSAKTSSDGQRIVVQTQRADGRPARLQIFDKKDATYELSGSLDLEANGSLVVSRDGRKALLHVMRENAQHNKAIRHSIVEIDLAGPQAPAEAKRWDVAARKVIVAADASTYVVSEPSAREGRWQTRIQRMGSPGAPILVEEEEYVELQQVSADGRHLVYWTFGHALTVVDLQTAKLTKHKQRPAEIYRYGCVVAVLQDGQIVAEDARFPRLGVYAATASVPRIGVVEHSGGKHCSVLNANSSSQELVLISDISEIVTLDLREPRRPQVSGGWSVPANTRALAVAEDLVFVASGRELHVLRIDPTTPPAAAWSELESAHRAIMTRYREDTAAKQPVPYFDAVRGLEKAGIRDAIDSPLRGIRSSQAAAILNDYGFLAARMGDRQVIAERFLRRAIAVDPKRAVAYLNLAELQRATLSQYSNWEDKLLRARDAARNYRTFISMGGKPTPGITTFLRGDPPNRDGEDACRAIANYANAGRLEELLSSSAIGIPVGGRKIDLVFTTQGTAHVPVISAFDSDTDDPLTEEQLSFPPIIAEFENLWGGDQLGLLTHSNNVHILHYRDFAHPVASVSLSDGRTCQFVAVVTQTVGPAVSEPELCKSLRAGGRRKMLDFDEPVSMTYQAIAARWPESSIVGASRVDFANDGKPGNLAKLELASGAGPGCGETFFDLLDKGGTRFEPGPRRDLLMKLQGAVVDNRYPLPCGSESSFFRYRGKTYFQNRPQGWPPMDSSQHYHRVSRVEQGRVADVCDFKFKARVEVKQ